jgi:FkbM family methyltransferase
MKIISLITNSLAHKSKQLFSFLKAKKVFETHGKMKIRFPGSDILVFHQIFIEENYNFFPRGFVPSTIIDAGANVGYSSIWFSEKFKNAKIIAIEPEEENFEMLLSNTANRKSIKCLKSALWSQDKKIFIKDKSVNSWSFETTEKANKNSLKINGISIPSILNMYNLDKVSILKIDIEGAEGELFSNGYNEWIDKVECIMIETHDKKIPGVSKVVDDALLKHDFLKFRTKDLSIFYHRSLF